MKPVRAVVVVVVVLAVAGRFLRRLVGLVTAGEVRYQVPQGQDPAALMARLRVAGLEARRLTEFGEPVLVVSTTVGAGRERVREVLRDAPLNVEGDARTADDVRFVDEA